MYITGDQCDTCFSAVRCSGQQVSSLGIWHGGFLPISMTNPFPRRERQLNRKGIGGLAHSWVLPLNGTEWEQGP